MSWTAFAKEYNASTAKTASMDSTILFFVFGGKPSRYPFSFPIIRFLLSWSFQNTPHIRFLIFFIPMSFYRLMVCKSLFSMMVNPSMVNPFGLSSERLAFSRRQTVTSVRSVTLLSRIIICLAYVRAS